MNQPTIETDRLILRSFEESDAKVVQNLAGNKEVSKFTLNIPYPYMDGMAEQWISSHSSGWEKRTVVIYAVIEKGTRTLLGNVSLVDINGASAELGYWFGEEYWNSGYCTEAARELIEFAFNHLGITKIFAEHFFDNIASGKVMDKIGMSFIKQEYRADRNGNNKPVQVYEISKT